MITPPNPSSTNVLQAGFRRTGWSNNELWVAAVGIGGELRPLDIDAITTGVRPATHNEHDVLATALNDYFVERGQNHPVAMWDDLPE